MNKERVAHVITGTAVGGAEIMLFRYLRSIEKDRNKHIVVSLMPSGPVASMIRDLGVEVVDLGAGSVGQIPAAIIGLAHFFSNRKPTAVHGWMYHGCLVATLAIKLSGCRNTGLIWAIHHSLSDPANEKRSTRAVLRGLRLLSGRADRITYCSRVSAKQHEEYGFPPSLSDFVPNAIDTDEFRPNASAHERLTAIAGIPAGRAVVGTIARSHPMKDHRSFAKTIAILAGRGIDIHGVLIGEGQPDGPAVQEAQAAGIGHRLTALPVRSDIPLLVPGLDIYLLSSAWGEALPLAVAEAMAAGVLPVVTDVGDCAWLVGDCGKVCPPNRPDLLANSVSELLHLTEPERERLRTVSRQHIISRMAMDEYISRHERLYRQSYKSRTMSRQRMTA
ncbi:glycosyltransferase [Paracoccus aerodenitrificans]|uniref:glycosyltransferase n=1 Tax=Paracoccus aerodenitrificans TaxID=3017781 RepID=UPI0022F03161|nr:glycosyltransferase [Paracoccus aerodenitrificans]WBU63460.1 glycosyltransferase [Paracoccus aerodenitrificans]